MSHKLLCETDRTFTGGNFLPVKNGIQHLIWKSSDGDN